MWGWNLLILFPSVWSGSLRYTRFSLSNWTSLCSQHSSAIINYYFPQTSPEVVPGHQRCVAPPFRYSIQIPSKRKQIRNIVDSIVDIIMSQQTVAVSTAGLAIIIGLWLLQNIRRGKKYKLPPRVPGIPFFGNAFQIPALQQGPWAKELAQKYGEMFVLYDSFINSSAAENPPTKKQVHL